MDPMQQRDIRQHVTILGLVNVPLGTLVGLYALWVLLPEPAGEYYAAPVAA